MVFGKPAHVYAGSSALWGPFNSEDELCSRSTSANSMGSPLPAGAASGDSSMDEAEAQGAARVLALGEIPAGVGAGGAFASVGSALHGTGGCKPCAWYWKPGSCQNGRGCFHCHLCPEGELKARRKAKVSSMRAVAALAKPWEGPLEPQKVTVLSGVYAVPEPAIAPPPGLAGTVPPGLGASLPDVKRATDPQEPATLNMPEDPKGSNAVQPQAWPTHRRRRPHGGTGQLEFLGSPHGALRDLGMTSTV